MQRKQNGGVNVREERRPRILSVEKESNKTKKTMRLKTDGEMIREGRIRTQDFILHRTQIRPVHRLDQLHLVECEDLVTDGKEVVCRVRLRTL